MGLLAGIIEGGLQGGAQAVQGMAQQDIAEEAKAHLAQQLSDQELAKMKAAAQFNVDLQSQVRQAQVQRVNDAQSGIVDNMLSQRAGAANAAPHQDFGGVGSDASTTTPGQADADAAAVQAKRAALLADPRTRLQAAAATGDLGFNEQAAMLTKGDQTDAMLQWRMQQLQQKGEHDDTWAAINANHDDARVAAAQARADRMAQAHDQSVATLSLAVRQNLGEMANNRILLKQATDNLVINPNDPDAKAEVARLRANITNLDAETQSYKTVLNAKLGIKGSAGGDDTPAPAAPKRPKGSGLFGDQGASFDDQVNGDASFSTPSPATPSLPKGWSVKAH